MSPATSYLRMPAAGRKASRLPIVSRLLTRHPSLRRFAVAAVIAAGLWLPAVSSPPVAQAAACTGWTSIATPPPAIRVLRSETGVVETVDFETYVKVVMAAEWNSSWNMEALRAGAVAVKEYAWYYAMSWRGGSGTGGCFDVIDNSNDQIYWPEARTPAASHIQAVESSWPVTVTRNGGLILTGYRTGTDVSCGKDADGAHMFQYSALECAIAGKTAEQILPIYYAGVIVHGGPTPPSAPTAVSALAYNGSAQVRWMAPASDGDSPITGYMVTSSPGDKTCAATGTLMCEVAGLTNGVAYTFSVTAANAYGTGLASGPSNAVTPIRKARTTYHAIAPPVRLLDTRHNNGLSTTLKANTPVRFQIRGRGGIPATATAVAGNLTVTDETDGWAVYLGPIPQANPSTSTVNFVKGDVLTNGVTVALGPGGVLSATYAAPAGATTNLVFDVTGYFTPDTTGDTYHPVAPVRLLDSRYNNGLSAPLNANTPAAFQIAGRGGIPTNATAVTGNVTVTDETDGGAVYLGPDPLANPSTSTIDFAKGDVLANNLTVALSSGGGLSATYMALAGNTTSLVLDVTGYFTHDATGLRYVPMNPARLLDSRYGNGLSSPLKANTPVSFGITRRLGIPTTAKAITGNVTVIDETDKWAIYVGPDPIAYPTTSTINFVKGDVIANGVAVSLSSKGLLSATYMSFAGNTTSLVFDVSGYFTR
jgi:hypothetical protein